MNNNIFQNLESKHLNINHAQYILNWIASNGTIDNISIYSINNQEYIISKSDLKLLDFNNDGKIDIMDVQYILNWIAAGGNHNNVSVIYSINNKPYHMFSVYKLIYNDSILDNDIVFVNNFLNSIIVKSNRTEIYNINIAIENLNENELGYATEDSIVLNRSNINKKLYLNENYISTNAIVLIHEILHVLGVGLGANWYSLIDTERMVYNGNLGSAHYKNVLQLNNLDTSSILNFIPIEDDFGAGTAMAHIEEGLDNDFSRELRYINNVHYPVLSNEIITGFISLDSFFTCITAGILQDLGYTININSQNIMNKSNNMIFI